MNKVMLTALTTVSVFGLYGNIIVMAAPAGPLPTAPAGNITAGETMRDLEQRKENVKAENFFDVDKTMPEMERPEFSASDEVKVQVNGFKITGQDIIPIERLLADIKENEGKLLSFAELKKIANKLTNIFRKAGYITARVYLPAQKINNGVVEYTVVIGKIGNVIVNNYTSIQDPVIKREIAFLKAGKYITKDRLERAVWLLTDLAGADAESTLVTGEAPGTVDIIINLKNNQNKRGLLYTDNYGNRNTGRNEIGVLYDFTNLTHSGDHLAVNFLRTSNKMINGSANFSFPVLTDGLNFRLGYSQVIYDGLGTTYQRLDPIGQARVYSVGFDYAIKRSGKHNIYVGVGYELNDIKDEYRSIGITYADKTAHTIVFSVYGNEQDRQGATSWRADYRIGKLGFNNEWTSYYYGASNSQGTYSKFRGQIFRRQNLAHRLSLILTARGQYASKNLDSYERMPIAGISGVRAYPQGEASGDVGYFARAELRWLIPLNTRKQSIQLASYLDHGMIWQNKDGQGNPDNQRSLQGTGIGIMWEQAGDWFLRADYAWRLGASDLRTETDDSPGRFWLQGGVYF